MPLASSSDNKKPAARQSPTRRGQASPKVRALSSVRKTATPSKKKEDLAPPLHPASAFSLLPARDKRKVTLITGPATNINPAQDKTKFLEFWKRELPSAAFDFQTRCTTSFDSLAERADFVDARVESGSVEGLAGHKGGIGRGFDHGRLNVETVFSSYAKSGAREACKSKFDFAVSESSLMLLFCRAESWHHHLGELVASRNVGAGLCAALLDFPSGGG